jgi:site-specific recombinase XerD
VVALHEDRALVFCPDNGTALDAANVRRMSRNICTKAGLDAGEWTPRELRHSFVSLMSGAGVPLEEIARLVGHGSTKRRPRFGAPASSPTAKQKPLGLVG